MVPAVVLDVAHVAGGDAAAVVALELARPARLLGAALCLLVAAVAAVLHAVAVPRHRDALLVLALELVVLATVVTCERRFTKVGFSGKNDSVFRQ